MAERALRVNAIPHALYIAIKQARIAHVSAKRNIGGATCSQFIFVENSTGQSFSMAWRIVMPYFLQKGRKVSLGPLFVDDFELFRSCMDVFAQGRVSPF